MLGAPLNAGGINVANTSKFVLYRDHTAEDPDPTGTSLLWITNNANVTANDTAIKAAAGSWGINVSGSTTGDIRNDTSGSTAVRIVVHLADGSNPTGQPLRLMDGRGVGFTGGSYGHLRFIGGGSKDNISFGPDAGGQSPVFQSFEMIDAVCHGGVGERSIVGLCKIIGRPIEGEAAYATGRTTQGGGYHLFTPAARPSTSIFCGSINIQNVDSAIYGHVAGTRGYGGSFMLARGGYVSNCTTLYGAAGSNIAGIGFFETSVNINGRIEALNMTNGYFVDDVPTFNINGQKGNRSRFVCKGPNRSFFLSITGWHPSILVAHQEIDASAVNNGSPDYAIPQLLGAGAGTGPANPTLRPNVELRDVQDVTKIVVGVSSKFGVYGAEADAPGNFDVNLRLTEGTTLGDLWAYNTYNTWPRSLYCDGSAITVGFGGKTRAQVRAAMAALGRTCTLPNSVTMVDRTGAVVDAPA